MFHIKAQCCRKKNAMYVLSFLKKLMNGEFSGVVFLSIKDFMDRV